MPVHHTQCMEMFNEGYLFALSAQVGINHSRKRVDDDSIDLTFEGWNYEGKIRDPKISMQLKCTSQDLRVGDEIRFSLKRKNYDDLRETRLGTPRYLAVLEVPKDMTAWTQHIDTGMLLASRCYWVSLRGAKFVDQDSITVALPLSQRLTSDALNDLLILASNREFA